METVLKQLAKAKDVVEIHRLVRGEECSGDRPDTAIVAGEPAEGNAIEQIAWSYLAARRSFCTGTVPEFERAVGPIRKLTHPLTRPEQYFAVRGHCLLAMYCCRTGRITHAAGHASLATAVSGSLGFLPLIVEARCADSHARNNACDWQTALDRANEALGILHKSDTKDLLSEAMVRSTLGLAYFGQGDFVLARQGLEAALDLYNDCPHYLGEAQTQLLLAHLYYHTIDYDRHDRLLDRAEPLCKSFNFRREMGTAKRYRGKRELQHGSREKAIASFKESLQIGNDLQDRSLSARAHLSLARAYAVGGKREDALHEYEESERDFAEAGDEVHGATAKATKALLLAQTAPDPEKPLAEVETLFKEAIKTFGDNRDRRHLAAVLYDMAMQYRRWHDYASAVKYLNDAVEYASSMHAKRLIERYQTEHRISAADMEWSNRLAKAVQERANSIDLIRYVLHDVGNLVAPLSMQMQMMVRYKTLDQIQAHLADMKNQGEYVVAAIEGLRKYLNPEKLQLRLEPVTLPTVVSKAISVTGVVAATKELTFLNETADRDVVLADTDELLRILVNLLGNAAKFTENGGTIAVSTSRPKEPNMLQLSVRDTGYGMPVEFRGKVFDLYEQGLLYTRIGDISHSETARRGFGLGLAFCAKAVEKHGGRIWVDPDETRREGEDKKRPKYHGTVIHFTLPVPGAS